MKAKLIATFVVAGAFFLLAPITQAGAVRYTGKKISQGSSAVVSVTGNGVQAAGGGVAAGGKATGGALKSGVTGIAKGARATPGLAVRGVKGVGKAITHGLW